MSKQKTDEVSCHECGGHTTVTYWSSVNVRLNPNIKTMVMNGTINTFSCTGCGIPIHVIGFLFSEKRYMIQFDAQGDGPDMGATFFDMLEDMLPGRRFRLVRSLEEMQEKIRIFDDELDDYVIEGLKAQIAQNIAGYPGIEARVFYVGKRSEDGKVFVSFNISQNSLLKQMNMIDHYDYSSFARAWSQKITMLVQGKGFVEVGRNLGQMILQGGESLLQITDIIWAAMDKEGQTLDTIITRVPTGSASDLFKQINGSDRESLKEYGFTYGQINDAVRQGKRFQIMAAHDGSIAVNSEKRNSAIRLGRNAQPNDVYLASALAFAWQNLLTHGVTVFDLAKAMIEGRAEDIINRR